MADEELPYRTDYAKSCRSYCKSCKKRIAKDSLRLAVMVKFRPFFDCRQPHWHHFQCFFDKYRPKVEEIAHFGSLKYEDQKRVEEVIKELFRAPTAQSLQHRVPQTSKKRATKKESIPQINIKDIFDEVIEENKEITECLNVLIKFKTFVDLISSKLKSNLGSNDLQMFDDLHKEVEEVFKRNKIGFSVHKNLIQKKIQTDVSNSLQYCSKLRKQSNNSSKVNGLYSRLSSIKSKVRKRIKQKITEEKNFSIDGNQRFVCSFIGCGKRFKTRATIRKHLRIHSNLPKPFVCDFEGCGYSCNKWYRLRDHINSHKGIKPFSCDYCEKQFSKKEILKSHIDIRHKRLDHKLICGLEECHKQFKTQRHLKSHQKLMHIMEKRFICPEPDCIFKTAQASALRNHNNLVHSDERPFVCQIKGCSKSYKNDQCLISHMTSHSSERNFKCEVEGCGKAFKTRGDLRKHSIFHSDIELKCDWPGCEYTTKYTNSLNVHQSVHSSERKFLCDWPECDKRFKDKRSLDTHIRIHNCDKRYVCSWPGCQYRCTDNGNLHKHRRVHIKN